LITAIPIDHSQAAHPLVNKSNYFVVRNCKRKLKGHVSKT
jgi:hypothetical protein